MIMSLFPDTPKTLLDELALDKVMDEAKWRQFDEMYHPVVAAFIVQRFPAVAYEAEDIAQETMIRLSAAILCRRLASTRERRSLCVHRRASGCHARVRPPGQAPRLRPHCRHRRHLRPLLKRECRAYRDLHVEKISSHFAILFV